MKMLGCVCVLRTFALLAAVLVAAAIRSASAVPPEKLASCCQKVNKEPIIAPITGYMVQRRSGVCVPAVIFQTDGGLFCSQVNAPWVERKIREFRRAKAEATRAAMAPPSSATSLLSIIITSTSSSSSSTSSSRPPSSSTPSSVSSSSSASLPLASTTPSSSSFTLLSSSSSSSSSTSPPSSSFSLLSSSSPSFSSSSPPPTSLQSGEETVSTWSSDGSGTVAE